MNEIFGLPADMLLTVLLALTGLIVVGVAWNAWRHPIPFRLGVRNIPRRKAQTFLVVGGLALSTMIITSALAIGDTIDYSTKAGVYRDLGAIDIQIGTGQVEAAGGGFALGGGGPAGGAGDDGWFAAGVAEDVAALVDGATIDAAVAAVIQWLPVASQRSNLSEAAVEIRGLGAVAGDGLALPAGLASLGDGAVLVNESLRGALDVAAGDTLLIIRGMPAPVEVAGVVPDGELAGSGPALLMPLAAAQALLGQPDAISAVLVSNGGDAERGVAQDEAARALLAGVTDGLVVNSVKAAGLEAAATSAEFITTLFITFGTFSIFSGVLLIFLIFAVLAAERQSELGMSRAVGQQRADLVRQFVTEGLIYNVVAAAAGVVLGVGAATLLAGTILDLLSGGAELDIESGSGGYDVLVQTNPFNPVTPELFGERLDALVAAGEMAAPEAVAGAVLGPVEAQSADMSRPAPYVINGVDGAFIGSQRLELAAIAAGYESAAAVWAALATDPTVAVIDNFSVDRTGDPTFQRDGEAFLIRSIGASDTTFEPVTIAIRGQDGTVRELTVIGVLSSAPSFYGALMNMEAAAGLGFEGTNRYWLRFAEGADVRGAANAIEGAFSRSGLQTSLPKEELAESRRSINGIFYLLEGFVGLGLLIGIAALGVVTVRAVVERRQQIGVLRAIGFQREMVQGVFLAENLFVAGLGTLIGYVLALTFAYNLYLQVAADQGLPFLPPWPRLIGIAIAILAASLSVAWLHARQSAKVVIAEALRYQA